MAALSEAAWQACFSMTACPRGWLLVPVMAACPSHGCLPKALVKAKAAVNDHLPKPKRYYQWQHLQCREALVRGHGTVRWPLPPRLLVPLMLLPLLVLVVLLALLPPLLLPLLLLVLLQAAAESAEHAAEGARPAACTETDNKRR
jgi:hypothetical protein